MKQFLFDIVLEKENICNLQKDLAFLWEEIINGGHVVFSGRRNTGKTSLVKNVLIPKFRSKNKKGLVVFVDFMGARNLDQVSQRIAFAFEQGIAQINPSKIFLKSLVSALKSVRPTFLQKLFFFLRRKPLTRKRHLLF